MNKVDKEIEEMAEKVEKATQSSKETIFALIKSLGPEGLKAKLPTLTDEEKVVLKAALEEMTLKKAISMDANYAAPVINGKVSETIIQEEIASDDADEKLMQNKNAVQHHQGTPTEGWSGQVIKSIQEDEAQLDFVIEKAMDKAKDDDKLVAKKLKEKGMDEGKVQGAIEKYKAKKVQKAEADELEKGKMKAAREEAKEKIMSMEEKEHGTKDPKKLVAAEKKENMKKSDGEDLEKAKMNKEENQLGDAPSLEGGKQMAKKTAAPDIEDNAKANKKNMTKSFDWEDENRLLKANTQGRNFNFNLESFVEETLKNEPKEEVKKSEKEDVNDIIKKGEDRNWDQVNQARRIEATKPNGSLVKSFDETTDLATILGLTPEEAKKILG